MKKTMKKGYMNGGSVKAKPKKGYARGGSVDQMKSSPRKQQAMKGC